MLNDSKGKEKIQDFLMQAEDKELQKEVVQQYKISINL